MFIFSLAKELGMTVQTLSKELTREELLGWAAFFELRNEEMDKEKDRVQRGRGGRTQG